MIGKPFIKLNSVDSTNNYAMQQLRKGLAASGTAYFAFEQTHGKGQRSKTWLSEKGSNIILSVVIDAAALQAFQTVLLNCIVTIAAFNFFNKYALSEVSVKWPNDLYWRDRKAGGILIENVWQNNKWVSAIIGLGININQRKFENGLNAVSLKQITGKDYNVIKLAKELCMFLGQHIEKFKNDSIKALNEYNTNLYKLNQPVNFKTRHGQITALVKGVDKQGNLLLLTDKLIAVTYGEVEWLLP